MADGAWEAVEHSKLDEAEKRIRQAIKVRQGDCVLWSDLGLILWRREKLRAAEKAFRTALLLRPDHLDAKANLAELLASRGFYRQAARLLDELAESHPHLEIYKKKAGEYLDRAEENAANRESPAQSG